MNTTTTTYTDDKWYSTMISVVEALSQLPCHISKEEALSCGYYDGLDEEVA